MPTETQNLNLFKYDPVQDAKSTFNIQQSLNDNWDKIDNYSLSTNSSLSAKATTSLDNLTDEGKSYASGLGMPNLTNYIDLAIPASKSTHIAPASGYFCLNATSIYNAVNPFTSLRVYKNNTTLAEDLIMGTQGNNQKYYDSTGGSGVMVFLPVLKNTTITVVYGEVTIKAFRFFYAQGEEL